MSPVSRGRKGKKNKRPASWRVPAGLPGIQDECDCPSCSGEDFDPRALIDELTSDAALTEFEDPVDAEIAGAMLVSVGDILGEAFEEALVDGFIPQFEARATAGALTMLLAIGSVASGRAAKAAATAADRLIDAGLPRPQWAAELGEPVTIEDCWRFIDAQRTASMLVCSLHRAGRSHAMIMSVNHLDCGAAETIQLFAADQLPMAIELIRTGGHDVEIVQEALDPAEFRWQVESALDARAVHDRGPSFSTVDDDELPAYPAMACLLRARIQALPEPDRPRARHGADDHAVDAGAGRSRRAEQDRRSALRRR